MAPAPGSRRSGGGRPTAAFSRSRAQRPLAKTAKDGTEHQFQFKDLNKKLSKELKANREREESSKTEKEYDEGEKSLDAGYEYADTEEKGVRQRYDDVEIYEYELPEDFEDEEIDEESAFGEDEKKGGGEGGGGIRERRVLDDLESDEDGEEEGEEGEEGDADDFSEEEEEEKERKGEGESEGEAGEETERGRKGKSGLRFKERSKKKQMELEGEDDDDDEEEDNDDDGDELGFFPEGDDASDGEEGEEEEDEGGVDAEYERRLALIKELTGRDVTQKTTKTERATPLEVPSVRTEPVKEGEFALPSGSGNSDGAGEADGRLSVNDLLAGLQGSASGLGALRKRMVALERKRESGREGEIGGKVHVPLPRVVREKLERRAGYEKSSAEVSKWQPLVKRNRETPSLVLSQKHSLLSAPLGLSLSREERAREGEGEKVRKGGSEKGAPLRDLTKEVGELLRNYGLDDERKVQEREALELNKVSVDEVRSRQDRLSKMRTLLFRSELKAKRAKKIKSKTFHKILLAEKRRKAKRDGEKGGDGAAFGGTDAEEKREEAIRQEFLRAQERMTLRHRNTSRWVRHLLKKGILSSTLSQEDGTREAVREQLRKHEELKRKIHRADIGREGERVEESSGEEEREEGDEMEDEEEDEQEDWGEGKEREGEGQKPKLKSRILARNKARILKELDATKNGELPKTGLFALPFMARALEKTKNSSVKEMQEALEEFESLENSEPGEDGGAEKKDEGEREEEDVLPIGGRFTFGPTNQSAPNKKERKRRRQEIEEGDESDEFDEERNGEKEGEREEEEEDEGNREDKEANRNDVSELSENSHMSRTKAGETQQEAKRVVVVSREEQGVSEMSKKSARKKLMGKGIAEGSFRERLAGAGYEGEGEGGTEGTGERVREASGEGEREGDEGGLMEGEAGLLGSGLEEGDNGTDDGVSVPFLPPIQRLPSAAAAALSRSDRSDGLSNDLTDQQTLLRLAFAGDDVAAEFEEEKRRAVKEEVEGAEGGRKGGKTGSETLPGWGQWTSVQKKKGMPLWMEREKEEKERSQRERERRREDSKKQGVIISQKIEKKCLRFSLSSLPFPFTNKEDYERSIRNPIGREFHSDKTFRDLIRPAVLKTVGQVIDPIKFDKSLKGKDRNGGRGAGGNQQKGSKKAKFAVQAVQK